MSDNNEICFSYFTQLRQLTELCNYVPVIVCLLGFYGTDIHLEAAEIGKKFKKLFILYAKCHCVINKAERVTDQEVDELSKYIVYGQ